ncbi:MAG: hypothetical protein ACTHJ5_17110 [Ilyomonas sp.]
MENWSAKIDNFILQNLKELRLKFEPHSRFDGNVFYIEPTQQELFNRNKDVYQILRKVIKDNFLFMFRYPWTIYFYRSEAAIKFIIFSDDGFIAQEKEISTFPETVQQYLQSSIKLEHPSPVIFPYLEYLDSKREESLEDSYSMLGEDDELDMGNISSWNYKARLDLKMMKSLVLLLSPYDYGWD